MPQSTHLPNPIVPNDSRYIPLTQQRWCCVPTCIQMVMLRHRIPLVPAELLGHYLKLVVPEEELQYFWHGQTGPKPPAGYGTQVYEQDACNRAFRELDIPLQMSWKLIDQFRDLDSFKTNLQQLARQDSDVLVCYDWGKLFDDPDYQGGHVCVLDQINVKNNQVRIIDPEYRAPKWRIVTINKLYQAMKFHGPAKSAGFWELTFTE